MAFDLYSRGEKRELAANCPRLQIMEMTEAKSCFVRWQTSIPFKANVNAAAFPIPDDAPVTTAVFPGFIRSVILITSVVVVVVVVLIVRSFCSVLKQSLLASGPVMFRLL